jgi:hypothetical protein
MLETNALCVCERTSGGENLGCSISTHGMKENPAFRDTTRKGGEDVKGDPRAWNSRDLFYFLTTTK